MLKIVSIDHDPGNELHSATLTDLRICTSLSWNADGSKLALIVDRRLVYLWDIGNNNFTHFKPAARSYSFNQSSSKKNKTRSIDSVTWSKISNRFLLCYSTGQMLLCDCDANFSERFIDNSEGVLKQITFVQCCNHTDLIACITIISELLILTFDGETKFYIQSEDLGILGMKFSLQAENYSAYRSPSHKKSNIDNQLTRTGVVWFAYRSKNGRIFFKRIAINSDSSNAEASDVSNMVYSSKIEAHSQLIDFYWLNETCLIACFSSGAIIMIRLNSNMDRQLAEFSLVEEKIFEIRHQCYDQDSDREEPADFEFKAFKLAKINDNVLNKSIEEETYSLAAITNHRIFYYELYKSKSRFGYNFEKVDDLDLTNSLKRIKMNIERLDWSFDNSMLAMQLSNGHILVYRTKLQDSLICSYDCKVAYSSGANEITMLDYGQPNEQASSASDHASTINVVFKPSLIAIGLCHLAVVLNNRLKLYRLQDGKFFGEQEYFSIIKAVALSSKHIALLFDDERLKLHSIGSRINNQVDSSVGDERFFPDPSLPDKISAFILTESVLIYSTEGLHLRVFCLKSWQFIQNKDHSEEFQNPILKLRPNKRGNKFMCLIEESSKLDENVFLYDLYLNSIVKISRSSLSNEGSLYRTMLNSQIGFQLSGFDGKNQIIPQLNSKLSQISDAIWDRDGRGLVLIERRFVHYLVVLENNLDSENPLILYVATAEKPANYRALYASHGIVSYQTSLGRIMNTVLDSHDIDTNLCRLENRLSTIISEQNEDTTALGTKQFRMVQLKLAYLQTILPIYSLSKCKDICEHLASEIQFNLDGNIDNLNDLIWKQLTCWSIFTMNLNFALLICRKRKLTSSACILDEIISDAQRNKNFDTKASIKARLLVLQNCYDL